MPPNVANQGHQARHQANGKKGRRAGHPIYDVKGDKEHLKAPLRKFRSGRSRICLLAGRNSLDTLNDPIDLLCLRFHFMRSGSGFVF